jgi:hypothetical protein
LLALAALGLALGAGCGDDDGGEDPGPQVTDPLEAYCTEAERVGADLNEVGGDAAQEDEAARLRGEAEALLQRADEIVLDGPEDAQRMGECSVILTEAIADSQVSG